MPTEQNKPCAFTSDGVSEHVDIVNDLSNHDRLDTKEEQVNCPLTEAALAVHDGCVEVFKEEITRMKLQSVQEVQWNGLEIRSFTLEEVGRKSWEHYILKNNMDMEGFFVAIKESSMATWMVTYSLCRFGCIASQFNAGKVLRSLWIFAFQEFL